MEIQDNQENQNEKKEWGEPSLKIIPFRNTKSGDQEDPSAEDLVYFPIS